MQETFVGFFFLIVLFGCWLAHNSLSKDYSHPVVCSRDLVLCSRDLVLCSRDLVLCSRDLDVLREQRIILIYFILITHKSARSETLIPWIVAITNARMECGVWEWQLLAPYRYHRFQRQPLTSSKVNEGNKTISYFGWRTWALLYQVNVGGGFPTTAQVSVLLRLISMVILASSFFPCSQYGGTAK